MVENILIGIFILIAIIGGVLACKYDYGGRKEETNLKKK